jgi:hypothetical protein
VRALASRDLGHSPDSAREGFDPDFEPARQAHYFLTQERLHEGFGAQALIDALLAAHEQGNDPTSLPLDDNDRRLIASILMEGNEELTPELLENAVRSLRKRKVERELEQLQRNVKELESKQDLNSRAKLAQERLRLKQAMRLVGETRNASDEI